MQKINKSLSLLWLPVIFFAGFIFFLSSLPGKYVPSPFFSADKIMHLIEYIILGWLLARAIKNSFLDLNKSRLYIIVTLIALLYGSSDEFHQLFVIGRYASIWDVAVDTAGGLIGGMLYK